MLLRPTQVAERLGVSLQSLHNYRRRNVGPAYLTLPGGYTRYYEDEVERFIRDNTTFTHDSDPKEMTT